MLLAEPRFRDFIRNDIADRDTTEVLVCLSADSREAVDELCDKALGAGAEAWKDPQDHGVMYGRSFRDLDGHGIEVMWMDVQAQPASRRRRPLQRRLTKGPLAARPTRRRHLPAPAGTWVAAGACGALRVRRSV
jgi:hypothetical protein